MSQTLRDIETIEIDKIKVTLADLYSIWREIGLEEGKMMSRAETMFTHVHDLVRDIYDEEVSLRAELNVKYTTLSEKVAKLAENLAVPTSEIPDAPLIPKIQLLRQELDSLSELREKRIQEVKKLKLVEKQYCRTLGAKELQLSSKTEIPQMSDLIELQSHIQSLSQEQTLRFDKYIHIQKEISAILEEVEIIPENCLEEHIFSGTEPDSLSKDILISIEKILEKVKERKNKIQKEKNDLIEQLTVLWKRLSIENEEFLSIYPDPKIAPLKYLQQEIKRCEEIKRKDIESFIHILRDELKGFWNKCGASNSEKQFFLSYLNAEASEDILAVHEKEVDKWKKYYETFKSLFEKIQKRDKLWNLLKALEEKANDPKRFQNRGGNLLKEEKERKSLLKTLPVLENQIHQEIENYEKETGRQFTYKGESLKFLITMQEYSNQKENFKLNYLPTPTNTTYSTPSTKPRRLLTCVKSNPPKLRTQRTAKLRTPMTSKKTIQKRELDFVKANDEIDIKVLTGVTTYSIFVKEFKEFNSRYNLRSSALPSKETSTKVSKYRSSSDLENNQKRNDQDQYLFNESKECPF